MEFNFNKYLKNNLLLKEYDGEDLENADDVEDLEKAYEEDQSPVMTIELDMAWDDDEAAQEAFDKYHIEVEGSDSLGSSGSYEVTGKQGRLLAYLKSKYYEMDDESIQQYYPELLDGGEIEETDQYGTYKNSKSLFKINDPEYVNAMSFDLDPQEGENDRLGPDEELMDDDPRYPLADFEEGLHILVKNAKQSGVPKADLENMIRWALSSY